VAQFVRIPPLVGGGLFWEHMKKEILSLFHQNGFQSQSIAYFLMSGLLSKGIICIFSYV
jgi:hypothetical protein